MTVTAFDDSYLNTVVDAASASWAIATVISVFIFVFVWFVVTFTPRVDDEKNENLNQPDGKSLERSGFLETIKSVKEGLCRHVCLNPYLVFLDVENHPRAKYLIYNTVKVLLASCLLAIWYEKYNFLSSFSQQVFS